MNDSHRLRWHCWPFPGQLCFHWQAACLLRGSNCKYPEIPVTPPRVESMLIQRVHPGWPRSSMQQARWNPLKCPLHLDGEPRPRHHGVHNTGIEGLVNRRTWLVIDGYGWKWMDIVGNGWIELKMVHGGGFNGVFASRIGMYLESLITWQISMGTLCPLS